MSQHYFSTEKDGQPVSVLMGWDRPLGAYFLLVSRIMTKEERAANPDDEGIIYSGLDDPDLDDDMGMSRDLDYFIRKLEELALRVPNSMIEEIKADAVLNVGNRQRVHTLDQASDLQTT